jgi:hypothetical protein
MPVLVFVIINALYQPGFLPLFPFRESFTKNVWRHVIAPGQGETTYTWKRLQQQKINCPIA